MSHDEAPNSDNAGVLITLFALVVVAEPCTYAKLAKSACSLTARRCMASLASFAQQRRRVVLLRYVGRKKGMPLHVPRWGQDRGEVKTAGELGKCVALLFPPLA